MRWGHITPIGGSEALLLPKTDLPNLLVRSCRVSLFDRHTQPNSYATTRPKQSDRPTPETVRVTLLPSKTQTLRYSTVYVNYTGDGWVTGQATA